MTVLNNRLGLGLLLWEVFASVLGVTLYALSVPEDMTPDGRIFWYVFASTSFLGWVMFLLVTGFVEYAKRRSDD
jgi:hypothetical protein